jgi:hypothetical protein
MLNWQHHALWSMVIHTSITYSARLPHMYAHFKDHLALHVLEARCVTFMTFLLLALRLHYFDISHTANT